MNEELEKGLAEIKGKIDTANEKNSGEVKNLTDQVTELKSQLEAAKEGTVSKEYAEKLQEHVDQIEAKLKKGGLEGGVQKKSFNDVLADAVNENEDSYQKFLRKENKSFSLELKAVGDMTTGNVTGGSRYGQVMASGIRENQNRKVHMSQIMQGGSIGPGNTFTFMRENGVGEGAIAPVLETGTKSQFDLDLVEATVNVETIAGWLRVTRKAMNNIPGFLSFLQSRLPEKFQRALDNQILYGTGTTPEIKGILTSGNFVASASASTVLIEKLIDDVAMLEDTYERDATGILLRPIDYYGFFKNKAEGSGEYDLPQGVTFVNGQMYLFGIPVYASTAITAPDYVVGDFNMGAQLLTQEGMRIEFFDQDADNVTKNKVTVRIEGNYALPVYGPDYFIKGTTATV